MKKNLLIVLFVLLSNAVFSQMNGDYNYSIAIRGYNLVQMPQVLNQKNSEKFTDVAFNGGMIKFNDNQISYRLSGSFLKKNVQLINNCESCQEATGKMTDYSFKIGFEKNMNFSRIQPYVGFDIGFRYNKFDGILVSKAALAALAPNGVEDTKTGFIASPVIGIKINPIDMISIFAEGNLEFFYCYENQETVSQDGSNTPIQKTNYQSEYLLNPVSVGIQIHLGSNK